mgnify:CR=1 FL=1
MDTEYYLIIDMNRIGKIENDVSYLFDARKGWVADKEKIIMDRLMGYDGESIGSTDTLLKIEEITEADAESRIEKLT